MTGNSIDMGSALVNILSAAIAMEYMDHGYDKKFSGLKRLALFLAGCGVYFLVVEGLNTYAEFEGLWGILYGLILFLYGLAALKGRILDILLTSLIWILIAIISAYMMFGALGILTEASLTELLKTQGEVRVYFALAAGTLKFAMGRVALALHKNRKSVGQTEDWVMGGTFFLMFIIVLGMFRLEQGGLAQRERYYLSISLLGGAFAIILLLGLFYRKLDQYRQVKREERYRMDAQEKQLEQIQDFYKVSQEVNRFRHDMQGKLEVIHHLLKKEKPEEAIGYIERMEEDLKHYPQLPQDTGNEGLNAALIKTIQKCKEKEIQFSYVVIGNLAQMDSMDLGNLLFNLLSNGVEAADGGTAARELELRIWENEAAIEIQLENSIVSSVLECNPGLVSQKAETDKHGFGMVSILEIIDKYHGEYGYTEEDGRFVQNIILRK